MHGASGEDAASPRAPRRAIRVAKGDLVGTALGLLLLAVASMSGR